MADSSKTPSPPRPAEEPPAEDINGELKAELAEWRDPDSDRRQALLEETILAVGDGQRSEVDLRESQLYQAEAALALARQEIRDNLDLIEEMEEERDTLEGKNKGLLGALKEIKVGALCGWVPAVVAAHAAGALQDHD